MKFLHKSFFAIICIVFLLPIMICAADPIIQPYIYLEGSAEGPKVTKVLLSLDHAVSEILPGDLQIEIEGSQIPVQNIYLSDSVGNPVEGKSSWVAIDVDGYAASIKSLDQYGMLYYPGEYRVLIRDHSFCLDGVSYNIDMNENCIDHRICPDVERFHYRDSFTGEYQNPMSGEIEELNIQFAAYEPESLAGGMKNPLIIWLHGFAEGGQELEMCVLAAGADALARDPIQSQFTTPAQSTADENVESETGAYVLIPQCPTYWMDEGDAEHYTGCGVSMFTEALKDLIDEYLCHNPDVDTSRIYIGGASNGAYMAMNMLCHYPEMFAAAFPVCGGYSYYKHRRDEDGHIVFVVEEETEEAAPEDAVEAMLEDATEAVEEEEKLEEPIVADLQGAIVTDEVFFTLEMAERIKDIPIWFVSSYDDGILAPWVYVLPDYCNLSHAGAEHCFLSMFSSYNHSAWKPVMNNEVTGVQDASVFTELPIPGIADASNEYYPLEPTDDGGGKNTADGCDNLFAWLNKWVRVSYWQQDSGRDHEIHPAGHQ